MPFKNNVSEWFVHVAPLMLQYFSKQEVLLVCSSLLILLTSLSVVASFTDSLWVRPHTIFPHPIQRKEERRSETIDMTSVVCTIHCYADWNWPVLNSAPLFFRPRVPFLKSHGNFSGPISHCKIWNLTITELFYSHILNMNRSFVQTRSFRRIHFSRFQIQMDQKCLYGPEKFQTQCCYFSCRSCLVWNALVNILEYDISVLEGIGISITTVWCPGGVEVILETDCRQ